MTALADRLTYAALAILIVILASATGCTTAQKVATLVSDDATNAAALAAADKVNPANASVRGGCYSSIGALAGALKQSKGVGILSLTEASLQGQELVQNANCQAVAGAVLVNLLQQQNAILAAPAAVGLAGGMVGPLVP